MAKDTLKLRVEILEAKVAIIAKYANHYEGYELSPLTEELMDVEQRIRKEFSCSKKLEVAP